MGMMQAKLSGGPYEHLLLAAVSPSSPQLLPSRLQAWASQLGPLGSPERHTPLALCPHRGHG